MNGGADSDGGSYSSRSEGRASGIGRRACLKLVGMAAASTVGAGVGSDVARAESDGYGSSYGEGPYDGGGFSVTTGDATDIDTTSATLDGELGDLDGADSAGCYFEWRPTGASDWTTTTTQTLSSTGSYTVGLSGLEEGVAYEYRAVGTASDGDTATGATVSFTTDAGRTAPSIDSYSVTEAGSPNPHCEITAEWSVSDADGDLDTVAVAVADSSGMVVHSSRRDANGASASGTDTFTIKHADGQTFDVTVTVIDAGDNDDSRTRTVTE